MRTHLYHKAKAFLAVPDVYEPPHIESICDAYIKASDKIIAAEKALLFEIDVNDEGIELYD